MEYDTAGASGQFRLRNPPVEPDRIRRCPLCGAPFDSSAALTRHSQRPHYRSNRSIARPVGYASV